MRRERGITDSFGVEVGLHQGSVLSLFLFNIVWACWQRLEETGSPWDMIYADDALLVSESKEC